MLFLLCGQAWAASISLAWDANTDPNTAGYKIFYGTSTGVYFRGDVIDVGNVTMATVPCLLGGTTYYFAVISYNASGEESPPSSEVSALTVNTDLSGIALTTGTLAPAFVPNTYNYVITVLNNVSTINVTPATAAIGETVAVNGVALGPGSSTGAIALAAGNNTIKVVVTAQDAITTNTYTVHVTRLTLLDTWRLQYFGTSIDEGDASNSATPQKDGVSNLLKFATGMDPTTPGAMPGTLAVSNDSLIFQYARLKAAATDGTTFSVMWTDDLTAGSWSGTGTLESSIDQGATELVTNTLPIGTSGHRFVRLVVGHP